MDRESLFTDSCLLCFAVFSPVRLNYDPDRVMRLSPNPGVLAASTDFFRSFSLVRGHRSISIERGGESRLLLGPGDDSGALFGALELEDTAGRSC
jgi:hypothetical protein